MLSEFRFLLGENYAHCTFHFLKPRDSTMKKKKQSIIKLWLVFSFNIKYHIILNKMFY